MPLLAFAVLLLALAGCTTQTLPGSIPAVAVADARISPEPLPAQLLLPPGPGPHPVVILLHGCGGISSGTRAWPERLLAWGYGSLVLDSLTPRSLRSVCAADRQNLLTAKDRAGDVVAAVRWLQSQPGVDRSGIGVLGDSHGGSTAAAVVLHPFADALGGAVKGAVNYYGNCRNPDRYAGIPLLALAGDADTWGPPAQTCARFGAALPKGSVFQQTIYPGVVHSFDNPSLRRRTSSNGHPAQYDPAAAADSFGRVHRFLDATIGHTTGLPNRPRLQ